MNQHFEVCTKDRKGSQGKLTIPSRPVTPNRRLPIRPRTSSLDVKMHTTTRTILEPIARAPTPMIAIRKAGVNNLDRERRTRRNSTIICIEAASGELVASTAGTSAIGLPGAVESALEELLVHGGVVDSGAVGPLPGSLAAVAGGAHPAVILWDG